MDYLNYIQHLYRPLQPSVRTTKHVHYEEIKPKKELQPFIYCYWRLYSERSLPQSYLYKVVSDGCIDIFFDTSNFNSSVMGFCRNYVAFDLGQSFNYIGIRFLPTMLPHLFGTSAHKLLNKVAFLRDIHLPTEEFIQNQLSNILTFPELAIKLNKYFTEHISSVKIDVDHRLYDAIQIIYDQKGQVNISKDINTGISPRQLRRLFQYYIGDSAKAFSKVVQFQHTLASIQNLQQLKSDRIYLDNGYYDQAHFIKDFKNFYGVTPSVAFG